MAKDLEKTPEEQIKALETAAFLRGSLEGMNAEREKIVTELAEAEANLPIEDRAKKQWDRDPELRGEFNDNFKAFLAFTINDAAGNIKILSKARQ